MVGSDLAGVVLRTGAGVHTWKPGDQVVAHCLSVELEHPDGHNDTMLDPEQRIWGFETNFGGLAHLALVKSNQLMPKPAHLTWEEAASPGLVNSTAYRQLISRNGAGLKLGDTRADLGRLRRPRLVRHADGAGRRRDPGLRGLQRRTRPRSAARMGAELVIDRRAEDYRFWKDEHTQDPKEWRRFGERIRELTGGHDVDIVFEHPGRETFGASVFAARKGGTIVTCASTSGYMHEYDNRYLWMSLKRIVGLALRELPRGLGGQRPDRPRDRPPHAVAHVRARRGRAGRARRPPQPAPGQGRRAVPGAGGGARRPRPRDAGAVRAEINRFRDV